MHSVWRVCFRQTAVKRNIVWTEDSQVPKYLPSWWWASHNIDLRSKKNGKRLIILCLSDGKENSNTDYDLWQFKFFFWEQFFLCLFTKCLYMCTFLLSDTITYPVSFLSRQKHSKTSSTIKNFKSEKYILSWKQKKKKHKQVPN